MTRLERYAVYSLPLISILVEIVRSFMGTETKIMAMRDHGIFLVLLYLLIRYFKQAIQVNTFLILLMAYLFLTLVIQGFVLEQYNYFVRIFDAKMILPLGFIFTCSLTDLKDVNRRMVLINVLFTVSIIIFSVLGIGDDQYGSQSGFKSGTFTFSKIYTGSFLILMIPIIYSEFKNHLTRNTYLLLGLVTFLILVLSLRRTSVVIVIIGILVYIYYYRNQISRIATYAILAAVFIVLTFPLYEEILMKQVKARGKFFSDRSITEKLQGEYRFFESKAVWNERIATPDLRAMLFGDHLFDSPGNYGNGGFRDRPLHLDLNIVLHGSGIIGLILLLGFYAELFLKFYSLRIWVRLSENKNLIATFFAMFFSHLFLLFSGGMTSITFNMISYLYIGATMGYFKALIDSKASLPQPAQQQSLSDHAEATPRNTFVFQSKSRSAA